jgi:lipid A 4'-phosphatase
VRKILFYLPPAAVAALALDILYRHLTTAFGQCRGFRSELIAISAYLLGPIAVVNWILKEYSGRPRPVQTFLFGGAMDFHAAGDFGGACMSNCSFVSGEAAAAGWLLCLIPLVRRFDRPALVWLLVGASAITPFLRLAMGGHYLSDVILGWLAGAISYPVIVLLNGLVRRHGSALIKSHT